MPTPPNTPFWLVWNVNGRAPTFKHPSVEAATAEAERLARIEHNRGQTFVVLESVTAVQVVDVVRFDLRPLPVPF